MSPNNHNGYERRSNKAVGTKQLAQNSWQNVCLKYKANKAPVADTLALPVGSEEEYREGRTHTISPTFHYHEQSERAACVKVQYLLRSKFPSPSLDLGVE